MRRYLKIEELLAIHWDQVERYGGSHGVRDLEQNHPFFDGNKRTAFAAVYTFLKINGAELHANAEEAYAFISSLYERAEFKYVHLESWLRANVEVSQ